MRVEIDLEACTGHGRCYDLAPHVFTDDDRGYGRVLDPIVGAEFLDEARLAAGACPERAVLLKPAAQDEGHGKAGRKHSR